MLLNTFLHIPGMAEKHEESLWERSISSWDVFLMSNRTEIEKLVPIPYEYIVEFLKRSYDNFGIKNISFFQQYLPVSYCWRLFPHFREEIAFLDIETSGISRYHNYITTISVYNGHTVSSYIKGKNLHEFIDDIFQYKILVTYNGTCFDIPFIEKEFAIHFDQLHIDLRYVLNRLGIKGGLKSCEKQVGIDRSLLGGVDGYTAVLLWNDYMRNNTPESLETLLAYNCEDVINLEKLLVYAYNRKSEETPFKKSMIPLQSKQVKIPYKPDVLILERIRGDNEDRSRISQWR
ncbi:ribonuclease H-like domain-containing protein [Chlamydiota bacterium]